MQAIVAEEARGAVLGREAGQRIVKGGGGVVKAFAIEPEEVSAEAVGCVGAEERGGEEPRG
jgi:hypothetical protein